MAATKPALDPIVQAYTDEEIVQRVLGGEREMFEVIMRRYNSRLYRVALAVLRNEGEAEDVVQDAYVRAYTHLRQFEGRAMFSTWLTRIAYHEALARAQRGNRYTSFDPVDPDNPPEIQVELQSNNNPEKNAADKEMSILLENAILSLPDHYRTVLIMRDVQQMDTAETAACLGLSEENVKVRLHRARAILRKELYARFGATVKTAFGFDGARCDRIVDRVFERISRSEHASFSPEPPGHLSQHLVDV